MAKVLTQAGIDALLRAPPSKRRETADAKVARLYFVDQPSGSASWAYRYSFNGAPRKLTIGPYPDIGLARARALAANAAAALANGRDPAAEKQATKIAAKAQAAAEAAPHDRIDDVVVRFVEHAKKKTRSRTARETERLLKREVLTAWSGRRLSTITKTEAYKRLDEITARAPVVANRTLGALKTMASWAVEREIIAVNVFASIREPTEETSRERVLDAREIVALLNAADGEGYPVAPFTRLLLMLGSRRSEVSGMRWSELDLAAKLWTLPKARSKNNVEHKLPLPDAAVDILKALPRIEGSDFVFTLTGTKPANLYDVAKIRMRRAIEAALGPTPGWTYHDLRRSAASGMAALGVAPHVIEAVLNHKGGIVSGIAAVYNRHSYEAEQRSALEAWSRRLAEIEAGKEAAGNVVAFHK